MNKRYISCFIFLFTALILLNSNLLYAETAYVSDMLILTLREGPGRDYNVMKTLKSNDDVEIIEEREDYYHVLLKTGEKGWVQKQYISFELPDSIRVSRLEEKIQTLEKQNKRLEKDKEAAVSLLEKKQKEFRSQKIEIETLLEAELEKNKILSGKIEEVVSRYEVLKNDASSVVILKQRNQKLEEENAKLSKQLKLTSGDRKQLLKTAFIKWFLAGGGVLFMGWLIGRSMTGRRKRSSGLLD
ncbi:MAG: TIGR04211 family SH3 domain-containing protein [Desulfobacteraceae bacterium]